MGVRIVPLAERPELAATVGRWHWDEWGMEDDPGGSVEAWIARVATYANWDAIPALFVALDDEPERWLCFLNELWSEDEESIAALQEYFGYVVSGRTDLHKVLLLVGPTRAGKGVIGRVLKSLVGRGNHAGPTLASLATNFRLSPLIGKPLAIISDARLGGANVHQVVERLLSVSGEDSA